MRIAATAIALVTVVAAGCPERSPARRDPAAAMTWQQALVTGEQLMQQGRRDEALPYYRRATRDEGAADWRTHYALALAIRDPSVRDTLHLGLRAPLMRSSVERIQVSQQALDELELATRVAQTRLEQALIARLRGEIYANWGFVWDPLEIYRGAASDDPTGDCARHAKEFMARMTDPVGSSGNDSL